MPPLEVQSTGTPNGRYDGMEGWGIGVEHALWLEMGRERMPQKVLDEAQSNKKRARVRDKCIPKMSGVVEMRLIWRVLIDADVGEKDGERRIWWRLQWVWKRRDGLQDKNEATKSGEDEYVAL